MRSIWSGSLSFGLINIPVRIYSATNAQRLDLDMLHKADLSPIRYGIICKLEEKEIPYKEVVKGFEIEDGEYVTVTKEDFEQASFEKSDSIEIELFTQESEVDTILFEKPYFLEPAKGASKAYSLLREALKKSGKVALASFILRNRRHMAIIKVHEQALILNQLRYVEEIRDERELSLPKGGKQSVKEMKMAMQLIENLTEKFHPRKYKDTYVQDLMNIIKTKSKGKKKSAAKQKRKIASTKAADLMKKLKASLAKTNKKTKKRAQ